MPNKSAETSMNIEKKRIQSFRNSRIFFSIKFDELLKKTYVSIKNHNGFKSN
jgi:hypothetical protein